MSCKGIRLAGSACCLPFVLCMSLLLLPGCDNDQQQGKEFFYEGIAMDTVMVTITGRAEEPDLDDLIKEFGLSEQEIDREYGVQLIDPVAGDYVILVEVRAAERISSSYENVQGPFSNSRIEAFGPPES